MSGCAIAVSVLTQQARHGARASDRHVVYLGVGSSSPSPAPAMLDMGGLNVRGLLR